MLFVGSWGVGLGRKVVQQAPERSASCNDHPMLCRSESITGFLTQVQARVSEPREGSKKADVIAFPRRTNYRLRPSVMRLSEPGTLIEGLGLTQSIPTYSEKEEAFDYQETIRMTSVDIVERHPTCEFAQLCAVPRHAIVRSCWVAAVK